MTASKKTSIQMSGDELKKITEQIYAQNADLAVKNKTLFALSKLYEIINTSLGVQESAEKITETIVKELQFQGAAIALVHGETRHVQVVSAYHENQTSLSIKKVLHLLLQLSLPLTNRQNLAVVTIHQKKTKLTHDLYDLLVPLIKRSEAEEMQLTLGTKTFVCYPLILAGSCFGVLIIGLGKGVTDLSRVERETLKELINVVAIAIERAQIYVSLKLANRKLKELDQLKDDFVSVASHALRTPMTAIKSYLWMTLNGKGGPIPQKVKFYLDRAYNSTDRLIKLVNDMLNISRIESGRMMYEMVKVNIVALTKEIFEEVKPRSEELGITLKLSTNAPDESRQYTTSQNKKIDKLKNKLARHGGMLVKEDSIPAVIADPDKIKEVLFNLIGNSLKFTDTGGSITVSFQAHGDLVEISVSDTGAGMEKEDIDKLFRKFGLMEGSYQTTKKSSIGTGLGLYISKLIVETHGGSISGTSEGKGKGSTFVFTLPVYKGKAHSKSIKHPSDKEKINVIHSGL